MFESDTDASSYGNVDSRKVSEHHVLEKKGKCEEACLERRRDFTPMVYSVDGMARKEARAAERRIAGLLSAKWQQQCSEMANFVCTRMSLSIVRSSTLLLRAIAQFPGAEKVLRTALRHLLSAPFESSRRVMP